ncbi:cation diffusion facilitator family transporter [Kosmotoga arenicorallina S304]|uniref:Cation diffusion facilitator family transporter n=1 Tax=Kosmotoga arenicorallina S304 TaxID=1453497 RepID=A0A176K393_9BACT|nr:cation diffusion facilitator family transporter [Kosmotoga arenicorallina]OAA31442.1 cation diffusion facilitator family transporter [Kosmotoga arenicorallina S304]
MKSREERAKKGAIIGIAGNVFLSALKILTGLFTGSMAITADGLDSATDIMTSVITLVSTNLSKRPPDEEHPYGHERAETIASKIISMIIFFAGAQLAIFSIQKLISGKLVFENLPIVLSVALISSTGKYGLYRYKLHIGHKIDSNVFIADAMNMKNDIFISLSVAAGMVIVKLTGLFIFDAILGLFVSIFVIKTSIELFMSSSFELMDGIQPKDDIYRRVLEEAINTDGVSNPHRIRIRKFGYKYFVELDLEVKGDITVNEAHELSKTVERNIKQNIPKVYDVHVHIEPLGNVERETFGLDRSHISRRKGGTDG